MTKIFYISSIVVTLLLLAIITIYCGYDSENRVGTTQLTHPRLTYQGKSCQEVLKEFVGKVIEEDSWNDIVLRVKPDAGLTSDNMGTIFNACSVGTLRFDQRLPRGFFDNLQKNLNLERLVLDDFTDCSTRDFGIILEKFPSLKQLEIEKSSLGKTLIQEEKFLPSNSKLQLLVIPNSKLTDEGFILLLDKFPELRSIHVTNNGDFGKDFSSFLSENKTYKQLRVLEMQHCALTPEAFSELLAFLPNMILMDIKDNPSPGEYTITKERYRGLLIT